MNRNLLIGLGVLVAIAVALVLARNASLNQPQSAPTEQQEQSQESETGESDTQPADSGETVTYSSDGYTPETLHVKAGATVTFKNNSSGSMWTASDPHPVHTDYPEFDPKRAFAPGESYSFKFDQAGNWSYHNHLTPTHRGTIIVE